MIPIKIKQKAFAMYCLNFIPAKIASILDVKDSTVRKWVENDGWTKLRSELLKEQEKNSDISDSERDLKLLDSVMGIWVEAVRDKRDNLKEHIRPRDLTEVIKVRRLIKGESTENIIVSNEVSQVKEEFNKILEDADE